MSTTEVTNQRRYAEPIGVAPGAEPDVRRMYEGAPYPDLGAKLKNPGPIFSVIADDLARRGSLRYLEAGCGTGHFLVGVAKAHPDWQCHGVDLSQASLDIAAKLSKQHSAQVTLARGSYLEPLPFQGPFDVISAMGTIMCAENPIAALTNLRNYLADDGWFAMHIYGRRLDSEKFDIKEILSIFEPNLFAHERRFALYKQLMEYRRASHRLMRLLDLSPLDIARMIRTYVVNQRRRVRGISWSPSWKERYDQIDAPWIDHFCHPCERAYEMPEVRELVTQAGFRPVHMFGAGKEELHRLPPEWREPYRQLSEWDRWRLMELVSPARSFTMLMRKA